MQIFFDACINQIGVEIHLATVSHSLSVDRYLCEVEGPARGAPGADFVQDIVVVKGKDLVVEVSTRSRGIACKRSWRKMTLTRRKSCTCNGKHAAADGVATGPATPTSYQRGVRSYYSVYTPNPNKGTHHPRIHPRATILYLTLTLTSVSGVRI